MNKVIENIFTNRFITISTAVFFTAIFLFARSFMGIYIFGFRVGELTMGLSMIFCIFGLITFFNFEYFSKKNFSDKKIFFSLIFIFLVFFTNVIIFDNNITIYSFRSSSYIWTLGFLFFGYLYFNFNQLSEKFIYVSIPILIYIYYFSIWGLPQNIINFILSISDKFEPHKGSDILVIYVSILFITNRLIIKKRLGFELFFIISSLYAPLILFKSRASFISFLIFTLFELYYFKEFIKFPIKRNIVLFSFSLFIFFQSIFFISGSGFIKADEIESEVEYVATYRADPDEEVFRLFYIAEDTLGSKTTRIFSTDNNLNWRLQIWQDVIYDLYFKNQLLFGYGYDEKIPAMEDPTRKGQDGLNENTHNYIITLLARGGVLTVIVYIYLYFLLLKNNILITNSKFIYVYLLPIMFNALFDVAMENSHFPLIFYFTIGMLFHKDKIFKNY